MRLQRRQFLHLGGGALASWAAGCSSAEPQKAPGPEPDPEPKPDPNQPWWLSGNFAPVDESEAMGLEVIGSIPSQLSGLFARNGPNPFFGDTGHWFLGDGMVHGLRLSGGDASWYRARYVQTPVLGVEPTDGIGPPDLVKHQANTSLVHHADRLMALLEIGLPYELSTSDLTTKGVHDFGGSLAGPMTAHPKVDPVTGELVFFGYSVLGAPYLTYHAVDAQGQLTRSEDIEVPAAAMMHDFQVTATHVVFMFLPILFDFDLALEGDAFPFRWDTSHGARIGVMPRSGTNADVEWFDVDPCYVFHTFNAFNDPNDPDKVILDGVRYPELWVETSDDFEAPSTMWRWEMTLGEGVSEGPWSDLAAEFPRIDPRRQGSSYRYGYAVTALTEAGVTAGFNPPDAIVKLDVDTGTESVHQLADGMRMGEAVFVPASESAAEDEGWLMGFTYDEQGDTSELVIVDAQNMESEAVARVKLPTRVPYGFHGQWVAD